MTFAIPSASTEGFQNAYSYDQHRPSYPPEAVESLLKHLQVDELKGARIIDLAAGTGKFTKLLSEREEQYEIVAIEPHEGMRSELVEKHFRGVKVLDGVASSMKGVESQCIDAVVAAQKGKSWHKDTKKRVFEAMDGSDVETNENGELALHGQTFFAWTTAVPGAPLKSGG
ncbi:hypothetical protein P7C71_g5944, partial [Lecanoromycetidae sp. Uapishka_2]